MSLRLQLPQMCYGSVRTPGGRSEINSIHSSALRQFSNTTSTFWYHMTKYALSEHQSASFLSHHFVCVFDQEVGANQSVQTVVMCLLFSAFLFQTGEKPRLAYFRQCLVFSGWIGFARFWHQFKLDYIYYDFVQQQMSMFSYIKAQVSFPMLSVQFLIYETERTTRALNDTSDMLVLCICQCATLNLHLFVLQKWNICLNIVFSWWN